MIMVVFAIVRRENESMKKCNNLKRYFCNLGAGTRFSFFGHSGGLIAKLAAKLPQSLLQRLQQRLRFNRHELAGSFGDLGTVLPLIIGMLLATDLDPASVFIVFGAMQILMGIYYGIPIPVQPLKLVAVIVITNKVASSIIFGGGLAIGAVMLLLTLTGGLNWIVRIVPRSVVRGIQLGLGISLSYLALKTYVPSYGMNGYILAAGCFVVMVLFARHQRFPGGLLLIALGIIYALFFKLNLHTLSSGVHLALPTIRYPDLQDIATGFLLLALPQLPLSISNSVIATQQSAADFFPARKVTVSKIGITYSLLNIIAPFLSGIPVCHGCGGLAGYHAFGARSGGAVVINGLMYITIGLFFSKVFAEVTAIFPQPILGVILLFEAWMLMSLVKDIAAKTEELRIAILVGVIAFALPQGYLVGIIVGSLLYYYGLYKKL
jgi:hypothetical protein